jgi:hypothetical protein
MFLCNHSGVPDCLERSSYLRLSRAVTFHCLWAKRFQISYTIQAQILCSVHFHSFINSEACYGWTVLARLKSRLWSEARFPVLEFVLETRTLLSELSSLCEWRQSAVDWRASVSWSQFCLGQSSLKFGLVDSRSAGRPLAAPEGPVANGQVM